MTSFVALYRGPTIGESKLIAVSADPELVAALSSRLLQSALAAGEDDPAIAKIERGRRAALRVIQKEARSATHAT